MKTYLFWWSVVLAAVGCLVFGPYLFALIVYTAFYMAFLALCAIPAGTWLLLLFVAVVSLLVIIHDRFWSTKP